MPNDFVIVSERAVLPDGMRPAAIVVSDGRIVSIGAQSDRPTGMRVVDVGDKVLLPGLVDTHVHINDPGRTDWEGFETGTRAAAAGGVTTVVDMPLNSIPATTSVEAFDAKVRAARSRCQVDVGLWGGVVPGNTASLEPLAGRGVLGFKAFMSPSGVDEFEHVSEADLRDALKVLATLRLPLLVHAESPALLLAAPSSADPRSHATWLATRPAESEHAAIALLIALAREYRVHVHVVHLASAGALDSLRAARREGLRVTVETCPHYLTFCADDVADGATAFKCAPPIRDRANREQLWDALGAGDIDLVATDHSPAPPALKGIEDGDFLRAWGGIASVQLGLPVVWTGACSRGYTLEHVARWMSTAPARLAGLQDRKGAIAVGHDADFVVFDPDATFVVDPTRLLHRHPVTPYAGMTLRGVVEQTFLRGEVVYGEGGASAARGGRSLVRLAPASRV
jgi:allantoinase